MPKYKLSPEERAAEKERKEHHCISCGTATNTIHDYREQEIKDINISDIKDFYNSLKLIRRLNSNGSDRFIRLYRQTKGNGSSWSVRFGAHLVKNNLLTIYPRFSYNSNIGCDESGVHSKTDDADKMRVDLSKAIENPTFYDVSIDKRIQKIMKKHYSYGFISEIKKFIATVIIVIKERLR